MNTRLFKVQDLLHKEIAMLLHTSIQNPEIKSVTISGVRVSKDLKYSEIYFTTPVSYTHLTLPTKRIV